VTLNITLLTPFAIYQSADFRLTDLDTGRLMTDQSAKTVILQYNSWSGFVTYTGLGSWYGRSVSEFVVDWLTDGVARSSMNDVALHLESGGTRLLTDVQQRSGYSVRHTFTLAGFENNAIRAFVISNFEDGRGATRNTAASSLSTTVRELHRNSGAVTIVTGSSRAVPVAQLRLLRRMAIAHAEDGGLIRRRLEAINATAARSPASRGTISEQCAVTSFRFDGYGRLQLGDETGPRPGKIPVIISGVELNRTLQDAAKRIGIDFSNAQMSNATFVSTRNPGPASAKSRPCGFPVSTSDISKEYVLQEITAGDFEPLMASDINDAGHVTGTGRDERQVPWTRQIPWLWKEGQADRLNFERRYVINVLRDVMKEQLVPDGYKHRFHGIMTMNDKMAKDGNEVATCMRKAAVMAREGYTPTALRWASPALDHGQYYHGAIVNTVVVHHNTTVASR